MTHLTLFPGAIIAFPFAVWAQATIPVRHVARPEAVSKDTVGYLYGIRELSDGRLIANDAGNRRLLLFEKSLSTMKVVADSATGTAMSYGSRPTGIIPYAADSTLLIDLAARAFLVVDGKGAITRVMSPPRPGDVGYMWNPALGAPRLDAAGRLIYRAMMMPAFKLPEPGKQFVPPEMPDTAPILRGDFDKRSADTVAWIRVPKIKISTTFLTGGGVTMRPMINPMATIDDWTMLPDGTIAVLRGRDYHIDWIGPNGERASSPKMPFDWKRLSDAEKVAIIDSTKSALDKQLASGTLTGIPVAVGGHGGAGTSVPGHSMTIMPPGATDGGPPPRAGAQAAPAAPQAPEVVSPGDLPDYVPPVLRSGTMRSDPDGNVWILPSTSSGSAGGLLYDVVNRQGQIFQRVRLPVGRALEGFGAGGVLYLTSHDATGARIERAQIERGRIAPGLAFTATSAVTLSPRLQQMTTALYLRGRGVATSATTRVDLDDADNALGHLSAGDFILSAPGGAPVVVRPSSKSYGDLGFNVQDPLAALNASMQGVKVGDVRTRVERLGSGDPIEGRPTEHYRITADYSVEAGHPLDATVVAHIWTARLAVKITNPFLSFRPLADTDAFAPIARKLDDAFKQIGDGVPVKVVTTTTLSANGEKFDVVQSTSLTDIKPVDVDPSKLALPAGFTRGAR